MPILTLQIKFTEDERALLRKRAKVLNLPEADVLRVSMICDAIVDGDRDAWKIGAGRLKAAVTARLSELVKGTEVAPVKA